MARKNQLVQFNTFVGGLVTEASPLTFPDNASIDEVNFELLRDGSRRRRLGFDLEDGYATVDARVSLPGNGELSVSTHIWKNVGGNASREYLVVQAGDTITFFDMAITPLSTGDLGWYRFAGASNTGIISFANIDGYLVAASGLNELRLFFLDEDGAIDVLRYKLKIRDVFGIEAFASGLSNDLGIDSSSDIRPSEAEAPPEHWYNLRNQGWNTAKLEWASDNLYDPIRRCLDDYALMPSGADIVHRFMFVNVDMSSKVAKRFNALSWHSNKIGNTAAPRGAFIIDALARGSSRYSEYTSMISKESPNIESVSVSFPTDYTTGGATIVSNYAGRIFYAGFGGDVTDGDARSPNMSSYILFSKLIDSKKDFSICYQEGDPTSDEEPDLLDTDGGFIRINEAYGITRMINIGKKLVILAANGVWAISGGSDYGFTTNNYLVTKITEHGCISHRSAVLVDGSVMYWSDDGIYHIKTDQFGDLSAQNISNTKIQTYYSEISSEDKLYAAGVYDSYERKVKWIYGNYLGGTDDVNELVLDLDLGSFYKRSIAAIEGYTRRVCIPFEVSPYSLSEVQDDVFYLTDQVTYLTDDVYVGLDTRITGLKETMYVVFTDVAGTIAYTFGNYNNLDFLDWSEADGTGVDAGAYLYTGHTSGGEFMLNKQVPYITFYFTRTEDGFEEVGGQIVPTNQSSCKVQAQWEWSDHINSGRWSSEFQAYRYRRHYIPNSVAAPYDYGHSVIVTKNKLRGKGRVLSLYIHTDPGKDCRLLGWSMMVSIDGNV